MVGPHFRGRGQGRRLNCHTCGYRLWNLPPGDCPECGRPFKPSDFEFRGNAVQYLCPHCQQCYYGTDENGHLVPRRFTCVKCSNDIDMDRMLVRPDGAVDEDSTSRLRNPWVERRRIGWFKGWLYTIGQGMAQPHRLIAATPAEGGALEATSFLVVTSCIVYAIGMLPLLALMVFPIAMMMGGGWAAGLGIGGIMLIPLGVLAVFVPLWALTTHGTLRLTGGTEHGLGRTWQCLCYGCGANCVSAVPCLSFHIGWIGWVWWAVSSVIMVARGQAVSGLRAAAAVLLLPAVVVVGMAGLIAWAIYGAGGMSQHASAPLNTQSLTYALQSYEAQHGSPPAHAAQLVQSGQVTPYDFIDPDTLTTADQIPLGTAGQTLDDLWGLPSSQQAALIQSATAALPPNVVAHRVGDYVFTYHGFLIASPPDPNLWVVILSPDPVANAQWSWANDHWVGTASGGVVIIPQGTLAANIQAENQLRAQHGLPPLPDPATVTHQQPAVSP